tara:strand:+ start:1688 stop:2008 length:321 start_codon:yes stop_codon:yes gene_type:complete
MTNDVYHQHEYRLRNSGSKKQHMDKTKEGNTLAPLEVGCEVTTNGGNIHRIAEIGFGNSEGVAENCFYHWDKDWPYEIEHAAMNPDTDAIVSVSWPNTKQIYEVSE